MAKITISDLTAAFASTPALNARFQQIEDALNNLVLYRDNTGTPGEPNSMAQDLDLNGFNLLNVNNISATATPSLDASDVVVTPAGNISAVTGQLALEELDAEKAKLAGDNTQAFNTAALGVTGDVTVSGAVDGRDISIDGTKLDTVEVNADVTDSVNVDAAGAVMHSDVTEAEGMLRKTGVDTYEAIKTNLTATGAPTVNDDSAAGYTISSLWIDATNDDSYVLVDSTAGAAVWIQAGTSNPGGVTSVAATAPITSSGGANPTIGIEASKVLLNTKVIEIGDWDMDTVVTKSVPHGLILADIRSVSAVIRQDVNGNLWDLNYDAPNGTTDQGIVANSTEVTLYRATSGALFDSVNFNATPYNRGWITIQYV